ncbi:UDP-N-acetylmuramoyl-tripeptide--D-alanyl-D-alanine ligase [Galbibacter pacificus]|uniref:UDP-N-acetylmuramoyl-tripeptide--D-alanyl-D-alanine ligase n=1 Tax=Galbibacter pacificus TaxID=2996052 RepID=A0ABT6FVU2_9FLAO|nr:UDP-N-acetylmuramoyl-tripeptide--D-alanyl-D-alanine ligase [Galbibacter pacificus]MDG3583698.1 UDP-N-acetylmuramoyl-tripeptide--D-alanyl-D-alanine ligase [Galbibacter pacificus]MDG3587384.1 UDP-N-acetylmuramoyl-tripeptide--D-alanyl-D-alanine ligase [Galbibacter pacificus]
MKIEELHSYFLNTSGVITDTRKIEDNCLFFALKGENFNGNKFAEEALKKGAAYAIIDQEEYHTSNKTILVSNTLEALQQLASYHRKYLNIPIIALTGSNGKTTTKELINAVLSKKFSTKATKGNLNNHIGVPITLLSMDNKVEMGVVEMGANHLKEIEQLCNIATPDYGYITNFGKAHLEGFGGVEGVIKGKSELYNHLINNHKTVFFNADDAIQKEKLENYQKKYGFSAISASDVKVNLTSADPFVEVLYKNKAIKSQLIGAYNYTNIAAAITIGCYFKVPTEAIKEAIEAYLPSNNRSQIIKTRKYKIILDAYNANPTSMKAALENFSALKDDHKTVILGDMFELGPSAKEEHQIIADIATGYNFERVFLIGSHFYEANTQGLKFKDFDAFKKSFQTDLPTKGTILIKGSRGMALERILDVLN